MSPFGMKVPVKPTRQMVAGNVCDAGNVPGDIPEWNGRKRDECRVCSVGLSRTRHRTPSSISRYSIRLEMAFCNLLFWRLRSCLDELGCSQVLAEYHSVITAEIFA